MDATAGVLVQSSPLYCAVNNFIYTGARRCYTVLHNYRLQDLCWEGVAMSHPGEWQLRQAEVGKLGCCYHDITRQATHKDSATNRSESDKDCLYFLKRLKYQSELRRTNTLTLLFSNLLRGSAIGRSSFPLTHKSNYKCIVFLSSELYAIVDFYWPLNSLNLNVTG